MLILNEGGVLLKGKLDNKVRYWKLLPDTPKPPAPEHFIPMPD